MSSTWFITGASRGLGRELTERLLARGDSVAATLREPEQLEELAAQYGDRLLVKALDVTDTRRMRAVVDFAFAKLGRIDVVVSNAGYGLFGGAEELSDEQIDRQLRTNLTGSIQLARAVVPHLRAQGGGRILQLSSMGGQIAFPGLSVYHATKWGIEGFYEAFAPEVAPFGIQTTLVEPGIARTEFTLSSAETAVPTEAYAGNPAYAMRGLPLEAMPGDPGKMASAIIDAAKADPAPRRLLLGSDAYAAVRTALSERLALIETQKGITLSTDADDYGPAAAA